MSLRKNNIRDGKQQGVAIILVLLIVAMATSLAAYIALQQNLWQRQVESQFERAQARQLGAAGIDWARAVLAEDKRSSNMDHKKEIWTLILPAIPVEDGEVLGAIEDRQGLFNLNNVPANVAQFQRLLEALDFPPDRAADLASALADWQDTDSEARAGGAEDGYYMALPQPYRASNQPLVELGELVRVKGFDSRTIESLRAVVSVLPETGTKVNVNFARAVVLIAVFGFNPGDASTIVGQQESQPFKNTEDFKQILIQKGLPVSNDVSVESNYFWVTGRASVGQAQVVTQVLLDRRGNSWPVVVWQSVQ